MKFACLIFIIIALKINDNQFDCFKLKYTLDPSKGGHTDFIHSLVPLEGVDGHFASGSRDETIKIWDSITGTLLHTFDQVGQSFIEMPLVQLENGYLASSHAYNVKIWDILNKKLKFDIAKTNNCSKFDYYGSLASLEDGLLGLSDCNQIKIYDITNGKLKYIFDKSHKKIVASLVKLDDNLLASNDFDDIRIWNLKDEENLKCVFDDDGIEGISEMNNGLIASGSYNLKIWNTNDCKIRFIFNETQFMHYVYSSTSLIPRYNYMITGYQDGQLKVWDIDSFKLKFFFRNAHYYSVDLLIGLENGDLVSVGNDKNFQSEIKLWDMKYGLLKKTVASSINIERIAILENGYLITGSRNGTIQVYESS